jgi:hypothetical protein
MIAICMLQNAGMQYTTNTEIYATSDLQIRLVHTSIFHQSARRTTVQLRQTNEDPQASAVDYHTQITLHTENYPKVRKIRTATHATGSHP